MTETTKTIIVEENGGPENMLWKDIEIAPPSETQVRIRHTFVGLNFIDTYHRSSISFATTFWTGYGSSRYYYTLGKIFPISR